MIQIIFIIKTKILLMKKKVQQNSAQVANKQLNNYIIVGTNIKKIVIYIKFAQIYQNVQKIKIINTCY